MSEVLYLHQTFTDCVSNQYTHFELSIYQIELQIMDRSLIFQCFVSKHLSISVISLNTASEKGCRTILKRCENAFPFFDFNFMLQLKKLQIQWENVKLISINASFIRFNARLIKMDDVYTFLLCFPSSHPVFFSLI